MGGLSWHPNYYRHTTIIDDSLLRGSLPEVITVDFDLPLVLSLCCVLTNKEISPLGSPLSIHFAKVRMTVCIAFFR